VLTPGRYREQQTVAVEHDSPADIINDVLATEENITKQLRGLLKIISDNT
jgi:ferritin